MGDTELTSGLGDPHQRFLSKYLAAARRAGVITNERLFARFPHERLFGAYKDEPKSRATLLCANSKMPFDYAVELDVSGCLQVFEIALNKLGEATADKVFGVVTPDELVRVMDAVELYGFVDETKWDETDTPAHRALAGTLLAAYKTEDLDGGRVRCLAAIEEAIGIALFVEHLPKEVLVKVIQTARDLADGKVPPGNIPFTVDAMAEVVTTDLLAQHLPLPVLMRVVRAKALEVGWVKPPKVATPPPPSPTTVAPTGDADDDEKVPTIPPPAKKPDAEDGDPEVSIGTAEGRPSDPPDADDAALDDLLRESDRKKGEEKPLKLDGVEDEDGEDEPTRVGAVLVPPPPGGKPPPLPKGGGQTRRR